MVDVPLAVLRVEGVDHLGHPEHPQGGDVQDLRLTPLEKPRTVRPGDQSDLAGDLADLIGLPAVQPDPLLEDPLAHGSLLELLEGR